MSHSRDSGWLWICLGATLVLSSSLWDVDKFGILYKGVMGERGRNFIDPAGGSFLEEVSYLRAFMGVESQQETDVETVLMELC